MSKTLNNESKIIQDKMYSRIGRMYRLQQVLAINNCLSANVKNESICSKTSRNHYIPLSFTKVQVRSKKETISFTSTGRGNTYYNYLSVIY